MAQTPFGQTSPSDQYSGNAFAFQPSLWAHELLEEVKQFKAKLQSIKKNYILW